MDQTQAIRTITAAGKAGTMEAPLTASNGEKVKMHSGAVNLREFVAQDFVIIAEAGVEPEDILNGAYWAIAAQNLKPFNRIEVRADDGSWMTELIVLTVSRAWASVKVLHHHNLTTADVDQTAAAQADEPFYYKWKGHTLKHCIIRKADQEVVHSGADSKEAALYWLKERLKAEV